MRSSIWIKSGMYEGDILSEKASYTLKSTNNNYCQCYNAVQYFLSFCQREQKGNPYWKKISS